MARSFVNANTNSLLKATGVVTAMPLTMGGWFQWSVNGNHIGIGSSVSGKNSLYNIETVSGKAVAEIINSAGTTDDETAQSTLTLLNSTWYHFCAVFTSATSRTIYVNGGNTGTSAVSV